MGQISAVLRNVEDGYVHWCPACNEAHYIAVHKPLANGASWTFDGNVDAPTFNPSVRVEIPEHSYADGEGGRRYHPLERCHYFIRSGHIEFCGDCTHALAGKTVPLPEWPLREDRPPADWIW